MATRRLHLVNQLKGRSKQCPNGQGRLVGRLDWRCAEKSWVSREPLEHYKHLDLVG